MLADFYSLILAVPRILSQNLGTKGLAIWWTYLKLRCRLRCQKLMGKPSTTGELRRFKILGLVCYAFDLNTFVYLFEEIFVSGLYFFKSERQDPRIVDCGSNIGLALLYFKYLYPKARVIAFEPSSDTFAILRRNVEENGFADVELHNVALGDFEGPIYFHSDTPGSLCGSLLSERTAKDKSSAEVLCRKLSTYIDEPIDFLKMDIEGYEGVCLTELSASGRLSRVKKAVIECHHNLPGKDTLLTDVLSLLQQNDFGFNLDSGSRFRNFTKMPQDIMVNAFLSAHA